MHLLFCSSHLNWEKSWNIFIIRNTHTEKNMYIFKLSTKTVGSKLVQHTVDPKHIPYDVTLGTLGP